jgi:hypothetical protein
MNESNDEIPTGMTKQEYDEECKDLQLFSAKNLVVDAMINSPMFYQEFMGDLRRRFLFEKVKIKMEHFTYCENCHSDHHRNGWDTCDGNNKER